jgi:hypothetical protein
MLHPEPAVGTRVYLLPGVLWCHAGWSIALVSGLSICLSLLCGGLLMPRMAINSFDCFGGWVLDWGEMII